MKSIHVWSGLILLGWLMGSQALASLWPGTVLVYSDGTAYRLQGEEGQGRIWQDQRLRTERRSTNPLLPPLESKGLDGTVRYRHRLVEGTPGRLLRAASGTTGEFVMDRTDRRGNRERRNYQCTALGETRKAIAGRTERVRRFRCERYKVHHKLWTRKVLETRLIEWSPRLGVTTRLERETRKSHRVRELIGILSPQAYRYQRVVGLLKSATGQKRKAQ
ncbi:MAG: hypothetical protein D6720_10165 [Gammaproteobacteria bacterium]|nr:MAG: hypothetical protein D6720_10165 [Gammaproteobacteria bacterium]